MYNPEIQTTSKSMKRKERRRAKRIVCLIYLGCVLILGFGIFQHVHLFLHCGRDFRISAIGDPLLEEKAMTALEILIAIGGLFGTWMKKGAVYFVVLSLLLCTVMIQHFVDLLTGIVYMHTYRQGYPEMDTFLKENYENYKLSNIYTIYKMDRIHACMKCCGINSTFEEYVQLDDGSLIPSCCPAALPHSCTSVNAYKDGCASKLLKHDDSIGLYHGTSVFVVILEFCTYRAFLYHFV